MSSTMLARQGSQVDSPSQWETLPDSRRAPRATGGRPKFKFSPKPRKYEIPDEALSESPDAMHRDIAQEINRTWED